MVYEEDRAQQMRDDLEAAIGHYMVAVAGRLLDEGLPVSSISSYGDYDDPSQDAFGADVEGSVEFTRAFRRKVFGEGRDAGLLWCGVSGWCFFSIPEGAGRTLMESARWMGGGLTPEPRRVAAFLSEVQLDAEFSGSDERPFYRAPHAQPQSLLRRLAVFDAASGGTESWGYDSRFARLQVDSCQKRVVSALTAGQQEVVEVALRSGELRALLEILEYVEGTAPRDDAREMARRLCSDLSLRARDGRESHDEHREAFTYAEEQR
ncbi:hypothetical protein [Streptomyces sp. NBC_00385]|uniref:hypothetical protein n=1 Tax=Streptomyces sp. NBC_00385 TaxID=2975733 RepID=UPI002DD9889D|nr:hypothetical protein [Streptomyces sp. NBC_00385]WRZ02455.1 hypothetical protein OG959_03410 [Streptomyces sp. NBC_00385]